MRQAGVLAAAGMTAIDETVPLLKQDHKHAKQLAEGERHGHFLFACYL